MKRILSLLVLAFVVVAGTATLTTARADAGAIQAIIAAQMEALRTGDADAAYAFAAPDIKRMFPTPERFMSMVRKGYEPVSHAVAPRFLRSRAADDGTFAQEVAFRDDEGRPWVALYTLARQPGGDWRITGCYLKKVEGTDA
ncbi:DUF4864 domain-containing protein [Acuticoccus sp. I52.16.1]|uniref:DUF4864 domain-containing protein n=1 Tax=Acuticoccus sp. I52.16.1 TaxID=2928472 RepID=UPI001FD0951C|nr:DUF4864 domain-containing protein [Acuticoccus sp. I52.16.1]UOM33937.1 DUF4864 domain-containing protein [Acuticoccus sp. I52.16.1]